MFIVRTCIDLASLLFRNRLRAQKLKLNFIRTHDTAVWHTRQLPYSLEVEVECVRPNCRRFDNSNNNICWTKVSPFDYHIIRV